MAKINDLVSILLCTTRVECLAGQLGYDSPFSSEPLCKLGWFVINRS